MLGYPLYPKTDIENHFWNNRSNSLELLLWYSPTDNGAFVLKKFQALFH